MKSLGNRSRSTPTKADLRLACRATSIHRSAPAIPIESTPCGNSVISTSSKGSRLRKWSATSALGSTLNFVQNGTAPARMVREGSSNMNDETKAR